MQIIAAKYSEFERNLPLSAITLLLIDHAEGLQTIATQQLAQWHQLLMDRLGPRGRLISKRFAFYEGLLPEFPELKLHDKDEEGRVFNETLAEFMTLLQPSGEPQVLFLDDLQWADWQSITIVRELDHLGRKGRANFTLVVGTFRSNEVDDQHPLASLVLSDLSPGELMELGPLSKLESDELVEHLLDEKGNEVCKLQAVTYQLTNGNPFYLYEYLQSTIVTGIFCMREESREWYFDESKAQSSGLSRGVAGLVSERLGKLQPFTREVILTASIVGPSVSFDTIFLLLAPYFSSCDIGLGDAPQRFQAAHSELIQKHLVLPHESKLVFFHDRIREAALTRLEDKQRRQLHTEYGFLLAKQLLSLSRGEVAGKDLFEAAFHLMSGTPDKEPTTAINLLHRAAQAAVDIYAYAKARELLQCASLLFPKNFADEKHQLVEWIAVHKLWSSTLAVSDQIDTAIKLLDHILLYIHDPIARAKLFAKKTDYCVTLFRHKASTEAGIEGLKALNERVVTREWVGYLYIAFNMPLLIIYAIWFKYFGRQTKEIASEAEQTRFELLCSVLQPQYYTCPIAAIANVIPLTFKILPYKDNEPRATTMAYWGVVMSAFGFEKLAYYFFNKGIEYFDRTSNPIKKGLVDHADRVLHGLHLG
ncbi:MAG TPA: hypothetical protein VE954_15655 [Oligoflexus sp.]|uniref:ATP-binding protein n=1 Tax=Oligoflexus sp. TaxID=1971216 RepID=UPI002D679A6E|nr:hypothetical protein [Oligoflexus sp.]HYX34537.1 hypothetical protein [Oligoflexus sp.]